MLKKPIYPSLVGLGELQFLPTLHGPTTHIIIFSVWPIPPPSTTRSSQVWVIFRFYQSIYTYIRFNFGDLVDGLWEEWIEEEGENMMGSGRSRARSNPVHLVATWVRRQPPKLQAFLAVVAGMASLVFLRMVVHDHENLFVAAEASHAIGICVLIYKLVKERTCAGLFSLVLRSIVSSFFFLSINYCICWKIWSSLLFFFLSIKLFYHLMGNSFIRSWCIFRVVYALRKLSSVKELNVNWQSYSMPQLYGFWNNEFQKIDNNKLITQACEWLAIFFTESCASDHPALIWTFIHLREMVPVSSLVSSGYWLINSCLHDCIQ